MHIACSAVAHAHAKKTPVVVERGFLFQEYIFIPEENKRNVLSYKDTLVNLAETNVPYKTKKRILIKEGDGFIQDLLVPAVTSLGFLML